MLNQFRLNVVFYKTASKNEPVREWLQSLDRNKKKIIGEDIKTVQFGWRLGIPLVRKLESNVWEIKSHLKKKLHGFYLQ